MSNHLNHLLLGALSTLLAVACRAPEKPAPTSDTAKGIYWAPATVCALTKGTQALVEAEILDAGRPVTASSLGLVTTNSRTEQIGPKDQYTPIELSVVRLVHGSTDLDGGSDGGSDGGADGGADGGFEVFIGSSATGPGNPVPLTTGDGGWASGYFFLDPNGGHWLVASQGFFRREESDPTLLQNSHVYLDGGLSEADFLALIQSCDSGAADGG